MSTTNLPNPINPKYLAAIDMGTNSFKMLIVRAEPNGKFLPIHRLKESVILGQGMNSTPHSSITHESQHRAILALHKFRNFLDTQHHLDHTKFVATSAVREAVNKAEFLSKVEQETSCKVEVLSGEDEARFVYKGILQFLPVYDKTVLTVDIGGGSTEFVIGKQGEVMFAVSLKLGHVSLTERFVKNGDIDGMRKYIRKVILESGLVDKVRGIGFDVAVGSSGTIRGIERAVFLGYAEDLMSVVTSYSDLRRKWSFSRKELDHVSEKLCGCEGNEEELGRRTSVFKRRSEFILAGAVLLSCIFEMLNIEEMEVSEYALGEGVIADILSQCSEDYDVNANARWRSVVRVATRFHSNKRMKSATCCVGIARDIFAGLRKINEHHNHSNKHAFQLDAKDLEYLEAACLLHNLGQYIGKKGYHKQSYHIIKNGDYLQGYSSEDVELVALLARHHRKKIPKPDHSSLHVFSDEVKEKFRILCAIVRVSVAVQQCPCMTFQSLETSDYPEGFKLNLKWSLPNERNEMVSAKLLLQV
ncbi:hypothetical protein ACHQM5_026356 [Ranunculus cassubicifolius]